ncbi:PspC domain-containing protein [Periweissella cryptocerci]|uniref:PspC domain-containing protein n=1 Tax=Periweissella cryptocerci TaxID=2506420 RepID=A0A4V1AIZ6_9LACO|nr:PspC domain-containing protein [Periweissella cryptocerci]QBO37235.1 PspC domain-containing protein [Periweissella cryptocerci]
MNTGKKLYKSDDRIIAGVIGGVADYFNIDHTLARIVVVIIGLFTNFALVIAYIVAALLMPDKPKRTHRESRDGSYTSYYDASNEGDVQ